MHSLDHKFELPELDEDDATLAYKAGIASRMLTPDDLSKVDYLLRQIAQATEFASELVEEYRSRASGRAMHNAWEQRAATLVEVRAGLGQAFASVERVFE